MLGKIVSIKNNVIYISLSKNIYDLDNLIGRYLTFSDKYIGEIVSASNTILEVHMIGMIVDNQFFAGSEEMPSFNSECRETTLKEIDVIYGLNPSTDVVKLGKSFLYDDYDVFLNINPFFSNHFAILGNTGSGKSYFVSRLLQGLFYDAKRIPYNMNIFLFDAYGEYQQAFNKINQVNPNLNYKVITTDLKDNQYNRLTIPFWLLGVDDIALLLNVDDTRQIAIIEKALKLVTYFSAEESQVKEQKNDIIARALLDVIFSSSNHSEVRNRIVSVLTQFNTADINLDINLTKGGWTRSLRQCIFVEDSGKFADIEIVISYLEQFCNNNFELSFPDGSQMYSINDFYNSLEFALISEGIFSSNKVFDYANILKIRLNSLINSDYVNYFICDRYMDRANYIKYLIATNDNRKCQIINFNINYIDDRFAKVIVKIISKLLFDYIVKLPNRASFPFHIILEEAHRYIQNDIDTEILGYNIFDRITKEGRKYGIILGIISQRPSEISETAISQCSNFVVFKMFHYKDLEFVSSSIHDVGESTISKIKILSPGNCILFGNAFKMPILTKIDLPNPTPLSDNCDIKNTWYIS